MSAQAQEESTGLVDGPTTIHDDDHERMERTPLPKMQLLTVFLIMAAEPVTATVIYPFINQFIRDTGINKGNETKTGYYAGIIESMFFLAECLTVIQWGYLSDRFGRRPILLIGPLGLAITMFTFGLSRTFLPLVISRCLQGTFNGNIGVSKSVVAEMTDETNIGDAYAIIPLMWSFGVTIAPILGGVLSNPARTWPDTFGRIAFFRANPYFLPCAAASFLAFVAFVVAFFGLKETLPSIVAKQQREKAKRDGASEAHPTSESPLLNHGGDISYGTNSAQPRHPTGVSETPTLVEEESIAKPVESRGGLQTILTRPILLVLSSYVFLVFIDMSNFVLVPLFYSTPLKYGGLGLDPYHIGVTLGTFGFLNSIIQANLLGQLIRKHGSRRMFQVGFSSFILSTSLFPVMKHFSQRAGGVDNIVILLIVMQLGCSTMIFMAYGSIQVLLVQCIPEGGPLGTTNGVAQMLASGMRTIAPTFASSLFALSIARNIAGGNLVFFILTGLSVVGIFVALQLPHPLKRKEKTKSRAPSPP